MCVHPLQVVLLCTLPYSTGLPRQLSGKESACDSEDKGDVDSVPGSGRSPGGEYGNPLQYSCLENPMDRGAWQATVHRVTELDMTEVTQHTSTQPLFDKHMYRHIS